MDDDGHGDHHRPGHRVGADPAAPRGRCAGPLATRLLASVGVSGPDPGRGQPHQHSDQAAGDQTPAGDRSAGARLGLRVPVRAQHRRRRRLALHRPCPGLAHPQRRPTRDPGRRRRRSGHARRGLPGLSRRAPAHRRPGRLGTGRAVVGRGTHRHPPAHQSADPPPYASAASRRNPATGQVTKQPAVPRPGPPPRQG